MEKKEEEKEEADKEGRGAGRTNEIIKGGAVRRKGRRTTSLPLNPRLQRSVTMAARHQVTDTPPTCVAVECILKGGIFLSLILLSSATVFFFFLTWTLTLS
ncbi:hypothetical protein E2C01_082995 [Portunus trituberculatus]|uniref:Uncharacterized protein n=1 Tax=Portunus trituberculatus TaxID=210409 RepID=A0A5B7J0R9_PORTR|nr:hypothetical protein [Portunus trituberculatus]